MNTAYVRMNKKYTATIHNVADLIAYMTSSYSDWDRQFLIVTRLQGSASFAKAIKAYCNAVNRNIDYRWKKRDTVQLPELKRYRKNGVKK